eukprot:1160211-Pelagomonas_calceolata.AAC.5
MLSVASFASILAARMRLMRPMSGPRAEAISAAFCGSIGRQGPMKKENLNHVKMAAGHMHSLDAHLWPLSFAVL